jgi:hypothetical protein
VPGPDCVKPGTLAAIMMKSILFLVFLGATLCSYSQNAAEIDSLVSLVGENVGDSRIIIDDRNSKTVISYSNQALNILALLFVDTTVTKVYSYCHERYLTKGEISIILADRIEMMPYARLTGVQNCLFTFCENNKNFIEFYFQWNSIDVTRFQREYIAWLKSAERKKWNRSRRKVANIEMRPT